MDQSALAIVLLRRTLYNDSEFTATAYYLEDLFYHRMHQEWRSYCTLTSFLEKVQQAYTLGDYYPSSNIEAQIETNSDYRASSRATIPSPTGSQD
jgi:hypothetical protein